jgi:MFS superfamily sulfate permease-like transporter
MRALRDMFSHPREDLVAGAAVFLVAVPLSLGVALASGVPLVSGMVAATVACVVIPFLSRAPLLVSGPAAGMAAIVVQEMQVLGGLERLLAATVIAGALQVMLGSLGMGRFVKFVPEAVVHGMMAGIGIYIIRTQCHVAIGAGVGATKEIAAFDPGPLVIACGSLLLLAGHRALPNRWRTIVPIELSVAVIGAVMAALFAKWPSLALRPEHFVEMPSGGWTAVRAALPVPTSGDFTPPRVWMVGCTIAFVASIETLLTLRATDGLDPMKRTSPANRELVAQGVANVACGWLGGIPVTASAIRSVANVQMGARERLSSLVQGMLLAVALLLEARLLNLIPLSALAAVLIWVGWRLAAPRVWMQQFREGWGNFVPFVGTLIAVMSTDLLNGVVLGIALALVARIARGRRDASEGSEAPR